MNSLVGSLTSPYDQNLSEHRWKHSRYLCGSAAPVTGGNHYTPRHNGAERDLVAGVATQFPWFRYMMRRGMKAAKMFKAENLRITKALKTPTESAT